MLAIYDVIGAEVGKPDDVRRLWENEAVVGRDEDVGRLYIIKDVVEDRAAA